MRIATRMLMFILLPLLMVDIFAGLVLQTDGRPIQKADMVEQRVYAYRGWQSMGIFVHPGEKVSIRASGEWLYSPEVGYVGPEGASPSRYPAPSYYPLPIGIGGCLIGRIGEQGQPFYIGKRAVLLADTSGLLHLRINDDIVTDNDGYLTVEIVVSKPEEKK